MKAELLRLVSQAFTITGKNIQINMSFPQMVVQMSIQIHKTSTGKITIIFIKMKTLYFPQAVNKTTV